MSSAFSLKSSVVLQTLFSLKNWRELNFIIWSPQVIVCHNQLLHSLDRTYFCITFILVYCFYREHSHIDWHVNFSCYDVEKKKKYSIPWRRFVGPGVLKMGFWGMSVCVVADWSTRINKRQPPPVSCKITWWMSKHRNLVVELNCKVKWTVCTSLFPDLWLCQNK